MASLKNRVICYHAHLGFTTRIKVSTGPVPTEEYVDLSNQPGITAYIINDHVLWVNRNNTDTSGYPETALIRVFKQPGMSPAMRVECKHVTDIHGETPVHEIAEQVFEDYFGQTLIRVDNNFGSGRITPVSEQFLAALKLDELIHSAFVIQRNYSYLRINYIDGGHALYLVPVKVNVEVAL